MALDKSHLLGVHKQIILSGVRFEVRLHIKTGTGRWSFRAHFDSLASLQP